MGPYNFISYVRISYKISTQPKSNRYARNSPSQMFTVVQEICCVGWFIFICCNIFAFYKVIIGVIYIFLLKFNNISYLKKKFYSVSMKGRKSTSFRLDCKIQMMNIFLATIIRAIFRKLLYQNRGTLQMAHFIQSQLKYP